MSDYKKCAELVADRFADREDDFKTAWDFFDEYESASEGEQIALEVVSRNKGDDLAEYDDFFDWVNDYVLSWDYVDPFTFEGQRAGYYRLQLSYGGPSDEFRIYTDGDNAIEEIEYWYLDWYDGASVPVLSTSSSWDVCDWFLDVAPLRAERTA